MKKLLSLVLATIMLLLCTACSEGTIDGGKTADVTEQPTSEPTAVPTTNPTEAPTLEPTEAPTPAPPHISWTEEHYVDDFNDETAQTYLRAHFEGTFTNSATSGSDLDVYMYFDHNLKANSTDYFHIRLFEYGSYVVDYNYTDTKDVLIKIKIGNSVYESHPDVLSENDIYIKGYSPLFSPIINALNAGKEISVVITESKYSTSTYRFKMDSYGLDALRHNWKG